MVDIFHRYLYHLNFLDESGDFFVAVGRFLEYSCTRVAYPVLPTTRGDVYGNLLGPTGFEQ